MERTVSPFLRNVVVSALLFGLFAEWLRPFASMAELTEVHRLTPFLGAIGFFLLVDASGIRGSIGWPLKLAFAAGWIGYWFQPEELASGAWWKIAAFLIAGDVKGLSRGDWWISPELRTLLFLAGWAAIVYAVYRIVAERSQAVWFVAATVTFLVLLQLWPGMDTAWGMLRASALGLMLLAVLNGPKWERMSGYRFSSGGWAAFARVTAGVCCGLAVLGAAYGLSARESREVVPVSFQGAEDWIGMLGESGFAGSGRTVSGYGFYDGRLGAPVVPDDEAAFEAKTEYAAYWRGATKDVYTGKGWRESGLSDRSRVFSSIGPSRGDDAQAVVEQEVVFRNRQLEQTVFTSGTISKFLTLTDVEGKPVSDIHVRFNADNDSYSVGTNNVRLSSYRMETLLPDVSEEALLQEGGELQSDASKRYLQLPEGLPERVRELARSIAADAPDNRYMQVVAIQRYLHDNYAYSLDTAMPPREADFVDHFLFETRYGYCNHFSSAMVVLLRAIGIEARWVKGFAPGEPDAERPGTYIVRGSDAHSWVEVRFPKAGWVPFEATPGFGSPISGGASGTAAASLTLDSAEPSLRTVSEAATAETAGTGALAAWGRLTEAAQSWTNGWLQRVRQDWTSSYAVIAVCAAAVIAASSAGILSLKLVRSWMRRLKRSCAVQTRQVSPQQRGLDAMWRRLYRVYGRRPPAETMREYAERLPLKSLEAKAALLELVRYDEAVRYGGESGRRVSRRWLNELWRRMTE